MADDASWMDQFAPAPVLPWTAGASAPQKTMQPGSQPQAASPQKDTSWMDQFQPAPELPWTKAPEGQSSWKGMAKQSAAALGMDVPANIINIASDPFGNLIGKPVAAGIMAAHDLLAKHSGEQGPLTPEELAAGQYKPQQPTAATFQPFSKEAQQQLLGEPQLGTQIMERGANALGINPGPPQGGPEAAIRGVVGGAAIGALMGPAGLGARAGALSSIGSQVAGALAPEQYKPYAEIGGGIVGGMAAPFADVAASAAARASGIPKSLGRMGIGSKESIGGVNVTPEQAAMAAGQLRQALGPEGETALANPTQPDQLVPGSHPTTAQVVPTPGAVALQKAHQQTPEGSVAFQQRAQNQATAQNEALGTLASPLAPPHSLGDYVMQQMDAIDQAGQARGAQALSDVQAKAPTEQPTEDVGEAARSGLETQAAPVRQNYQALYQAVDPEGKWALPPTPLSDAAKEIQSNLSSTEDVRPIEQKLINRAANLPGVVLFKELGQIRRDINAEAQKIGGDPNYGRNSANMARMMQLKTALDKSINDATNERVTTESQAVASGQMTEEQTMRAALQRMGQGSNEQLSANMGSRVAGEGGPGTISGGSATTNLGVNGETSQTGGGPGGAPGTQGVPGQAQPLTPNFSSEYAQRYQTATNAYRAFAQRFGIGGVGQVLQKGGEGTYFVPEGKVPGKLFPNGPIAPQEARQFISAMGSPENAVGAARNIVGQQLRSRNIVKADGQLDLGRFNKYIQDPDTVATLSQFPGLMEQFKDYGSAQETLNQVTAEHTKAMQEFQKSPIGRFASMDPQIAWRRAMASGEDSVRKLVDFARGNPEAMEGLKRIALDDMLKRVESSRPVGTTDDNFLRSDATQKFVRNERGSLKQVFGGQGYQTLDAVAADLRRQSARPAVTGSDTTSNLLKANQIGLIPHRSGLSNTVFGLLVERLAEGHGMSGITRAGVTLAAMGLKKLHDTYTQAGINTVNDLVREVMLHPDVARTVLTKIPVNATDVPPILLRKVNAALQSTLATTSAQPQQ